MNHCQLIEERIYSAKKPTIIQLYVKKNRIIAFVFVFDLIEERKICFGFLVKHIYSVDGFTGLFRGYGCAVLAKAVAVYTTAKVDAVKANLSKVDDCCFFLLFVASRSC